MIAPPLVMPDYSVSPARFKTGSGRQIRLRGVNCQSNESQNEYQKVADLGCNMVRLPCFWDKIEPNAPQGAGTDWATYGHTYDETVLAHIDAMVQYFAQLSVQGRPVMVQIDLHQAGWSSYFGGFSSIPGWYYTDPRFRAVQNSGQGWNDTTDKSSAIAAWWTSESNLSQTFFKKFAAMMVARYSKYANVVMYNPFNEPNPGNMKGTCASKVFAMHQWLAPVVRAMSAADTPAGGAPKRAINVMCLGGGQGFGTATYAAFGTRAQMQALNLVVEAHMYYVGQPPGVGAVATPDIGLDAAGDYYFPSTDAVHINLTPGYTGLEKWQQALYNVYAAKANALHLPLFIGEWGVNFDDPGALQYEADMHQMFDANDWSCTRWLLAEVSGPNSTNLLQNGSLTGTGRSLQKWFQGSVFAGKTP